jgi:undecaprenyl diphosphate synthase
LAPEDVQEIMYKVMDRTKDFKDLILNICFIYCGKMEAERAITSAYNDVVKVHSGEIELEQN